MDDKMPLVVVSEDEVGIGNRVANGKSFRQAPVVERWSDAIDRPNAKLLNARMRMVQHELPSIRRRDREHARVTVAHQLADCAAVDQLYDAQALSLAEGCERGACINGLNRPFNVSQRQARGFGPN